MTMQQYLPTTDIEALYKAKEMLFLNADAAPCSVALPTLPFGMPEILDAAERLKRFDPFIKRVFPETNESGGIIESPLIETPRLLDALVQNSQAQLSQNIHARLFVKMDADLPIAGSVKARGGIYEVLKHTESLALRHGLIKDLSDYEKLGDKSEFFSKYAIHVGSTGNLGLSIGIMSSMIGYRVTVHMSCDAKQWKKDLLRKKGVTVIEYASDYQAAVRRGREMASADETSHFIDDENSLDLFMGYAVATLRLKNQLDVLNISVDAAHPLFVYLPCGVGGAPGGITFGLKQVFGDNVHCFFIEPVNAPCMLTAFVKGECVPVSEIGLSGVTEADGLAVSCASNLVYSAMKQLMDGEFTVQDSRLIPRIRLLHETEGLFIEPSAASAICGFEGMLSPAGQQYMRKAGVERDSTHILWATGGRLVPEDERRLLLGV